MANLPQRTGFARFCRAGGEATPYSRGIASGGFDSANRREQSPPEGSGAFAGIWKRGFWGSEWPTRVKQKPYFQAK